MHNHNECTAPNEGACTSGVLVGVGGLPGGCGSVSQFIEVTGHSLLLNNATVLSHDSWEGGTRVSRGEGERG